MKSWILYPVLSRLHNYYYYEVNTGVSIMFGISTLDLCFNENCLEFHDCNICYLTVKLAHYHREDRALDLGKYTTARTMDLC